jgi:glycosyltransferase involved in cell wall biosynthesis
LGVSPHVTWIPGVKYAELREYVSAVNAVVVPSLVEGFGFSAAETCAIGKDLVVTSA